ncbi:MAG: SpoIIE family protein phosphatase, partial [Anaerolineae bacterium]
AVDHVIRVYFDDPDPDVAASLERAIQAANAALYAAAADGPERGRGGTTLVAAVIQERGSARRGVANVGDSRAYLLRGRELRQISRDHSWAAALQGAPAQGAARHVVTRALGLRPEVKVDLFAHKLRAGDRILLCTDGLTGPLPDAEIGAIARRRQPQEAARRLVEAANEQGGPDNVSVILVQVAGQPSAGAGAWRAAVERVWPSGVPAAALIALAVLAMILLMGLGFVLGRLLF